MKAYIALGILLAVILPGIAVSAQERGGHLVVVDESIVVSLDPHSAEEMPSLMALDLLYNGLVTMNSDYEIIPDVASSWVYSEDLLSLTFSLREGVLFHSGREMKADDVVYSFQRMMDPDTGFPFASAFWAVADVFAVDDYAVEFVFSEPNVPFLSFLTQQGVAIVDRDIVTANGDLVRADGGTGPFRLMQWVQDEYVLFERHAGYWNSGLPYLDELTIRTLADTEDRLTALVTGDAHLAVGSIPLAEIDRLRQVPGIEVLSTGSLIWDYVGLNHHVAPLDDLRVRQAIAYAVDRQAILDTVWAGEGRISGCGPVGTAVWYGCDDEVFPAHGDVSEARQLLAAAGYEDGFEVRMAVPSDYESLVAEAQLFRAALAEIGIAVTLDMYSWDDFLSEWAAGNFAMYVVNWVNEPDPDALYYSLYHPEGYYAWDAFDNAEISSLILEARSVSDQTRRASLYQHIARQVTENVASVYLVNPDSFGLRRTNVMGFEPHPDNRLSALESTWLEQ